MFGKMDIGRVMQIFRRGNKKHRRIAAIGMFDGVHRGHRFLIDFLKEEGAKRSLTPTVVTFATHPLATVRPDDCPRLLTTVDQKMALLQEAGIDDCVLLEFNDSLRRQSARHFLKRLKNSYAVDALVIGFNHSFGHDHVKGIDAYRAIGGDVGIEIIAAPEYTGEYAPVSSSIIRKYIDEGNLDQATRALGHWFAVSGTVVEGNRIGRTLGYPTANLQPDSGMQQLPARGVYAAIVTTDEGERLGAMVNIGTRPTVDDGDSQIHIEVHIFDYLSYLYGRRIEVEFVSFMRAEKRYSSLDKLKSQLSADERHARQLLQELASGGCDD